MDTETERDYAEEAANARLILSEYIVVATPAGEAGVEIARSNHIDEALMIARSSLLNAEEGGSVTVQFFPPEEV